MMQETVSVRQVRHPLTHEMVEVPTFYGRPNEVPQDEVDAAVEIFETWARNELHLDWMVHGYRALRAGLLRASGGVNPDAMESHEDAINAFEGSCLHGFITQNDRHRTENPILGTYRETQTRVCKYCGLEDQVVRANNYSGD